MRQRYKPPRWLYAILIVLLAVVLLELLAFLGLGYLGYWYYADGPGKMMPPPPVSDNFPPYHQ